MSGSCRATPDYVYYPALSSRSLPNLGCEAPETACSEMGATRNAREPIGLSRCVAAYPSPVASETPALQ